MKDEIKEQSKNTKKQSVILTPNLIASLAPDSPLLKGRAAQNSSSDEDHVAKSRSPKSPGFKKKASAKSKKSSASSKSPKSSKSPISPPGEMIKVQTNVTKKKESPTKEKHDEIVKFKTKRGSQVHFDTDEEKMVNLSINTDPIGRKTPDYAV